MEQDCRILKAAFPAGITDGEIEILVFLIHDHFSQRTLARLIADCLG